jgi:hypothetical protein
MASNESENEDNVEYDENSLPLFDSPMNAHKNTEDLFDINKEIERKEENLKKVNLSFEMRCQI